MIIPDYYYGFTIILGVHEPPKEHVTQFHDNPNYVMTFEISVDIILKHSSNFNSFRSKSVQFFYITFNVSLLSNKLKLYTITPGYSLPLLLVTSNLYTASNTRQVIVKSHYEEVIVITRVRGRAEDECNNNDNL